MTGGLLQMSGIVVDFVHRVERLPAPGEEVEAHATQLIAGGGFNAMVAARRLGADVAYGGAFGVGPFAELARAALAAEGIPVLQRGRAKIDQGVCVVLVDASGERSFISHHGAERALTAADLAAIPATDYDWILLSGYSLYHPLSASAFESWLNALPRGPRLLFDPGPVVDGIDKSRLARALARANWVSANRREAEALTGRHDAAQAAAALAVGREGALVRDNAAGCWLACRGGAPEHIAGFAVDSIDTTGAGDTHDGSFIAASLGGWRPRASAILANAAAAISVTRVGPATAPTLSEVFNFLETRGVNLNQLEQSAGDRSEATAPIR
jgi:sugar/nucleoside kinase (ribokinase family)